VTQAVFLIALANALLAALAVLFSSLSTPVLSVVYTLGLYATGLVVERPAGLRRPDAGCAGHARARRPPTSSRTSTVQTCARTVAHMETAPTLAARRSRSATPAAYCRRRARARRRRVREEGAQVSRPSDARSARVLAAALAVFAACGTLGGRGRAPAEAKLPRPEPLAELSYYPSGTWLAPAAMGDATAWSDLLWLRAVQYYGLHRRPTTRSCAWATSSTSSTTLDPRFQSAYVFGGTSLCQEAHQFDAGVRLLEKGQRNNPTAWIYPFELGFVHYLGKRDLTRATFDFAQAARQPAAPDYCQRFAAWSGQRAGYEAVAVELWRQVAETTDNAILRDRAVDHLRALLKGHDQREGARALGGVAASLTGVVPQRKETAVKGGRS
jgi:hypothetical protein